MILSLIEDLHTGTTSRVRLDGVISDSFFTSGVRQGCILARAINWILERTVQVAGIQVGDHPYIDLDYADDVVLMAEETDSLRASLEQFHEKTWSASVMAKDKSTEPRLR